MGPLLHDGVQLVEDIVGPYSGPGGIRLEQARLKFCEGVGRGISPGTHKQQFTLLSLRSTGPSIGAMATRGNDGTA